MDRIIPWSYWVDMIHPFYFCNKRGGRVIGIEVMLRMYLMHIWFNLSDEGIEDSIYEHSCIYYFNEQQVANAATLLKIRRMIE